MYPLSNHFNSYKKNDVGILYDTHMSFIFIKATMNYEKLNNGLNF